MQLIKPTKQDKPYKYGGQTQPQSRDFHWCHKHVAISDSNALQDIEQLACPNGTARVMRGDTPYSPAVSSKKSGILQT